MPSPINDDAPVCASTNASKFTIAPVEQIMAAFLAWNSMI
jgi:hypothetical protein